MKQFKCSMSKKKESLVKKQESISGKYLMDPVQFEKDIREMINGEYEDILKGCDDKERQYYEMAWQVWDDCGYDYAGELYKKLQQQMYEYVSGSDYKMFGNFANIQWDWDDDHKDGIKFADLRKKLLDGVKDADTDEFSTWAIDWFFHAFGTYNMCYNFATDLGEEAATLEQEDEEERERENSDESKKNEARSDIWDEGNELADQLRVRLDTDWSSIEDDHDIDIDQETKPDGKVLAIIYFDGNKVCSASGNDTDGWEMVPTRTRKGRQYDSLDSLLADIVDEFSFYGLGNENNESKKNEKGTTKIETYEGFDELLGYADAEYLLEDVVDVLSQYYTYEDETFDEDQAKDDPEFTIKIEGGDERADYYYENIFYVHLPNKEAAEELAKVLGGNVSESKKHSEKRTVTIPAVSYDVFTYDELSDQAKETAREKVRDSILQWRGDDSDVFTDSCGTTLNELFPNSDLNVQYSLSYCQGDGLNTSGKLKVDDLLNVDLTAYPLNGSGIKPLEDKEAIKATCEKADVTSIDLPENRRYCYSMADRIEVVPYYDVDLTDEETALLSELEKFAQDVMGRINSQLEHDGYDWFYEVTDEDIADEIEIREYEFTEDGEIE